MTISVKFLLIFLISRATGEEIYQEEEIEIEEASKELKSTLLDFGLNEKVKTGEFADRRSYDWLKTSCDFSSVNDSHSSQCNFGSVDKKWLVFYAEDRISGDIDLRPTFPLVGLWSDNETSATLYSDPISCALNNVSFIELKLWVKGAWEFQICFLYLQNGSEISCGTLISSKNLVIHKMILAEPFPTYVTGSNIEPMIIKLHATVKKGVVLMDDINIAGMQCSPDDESEQPISIVDVKTFRLADRDIYNQLLAPITKKPFGKYLDTIMKLHGSSLHQLPASHLCEQVHCRTSDTSCVYDGHLGTVQWYFTRKPDDIVSEEMKQLKFKSTFVATFPHNLHAFAILTSGKFSFDEASLSDDKFQLSFTYNEAAARRKILVCHKLLDQASHNCKRITKGENKPGLEQKWVTATVFTPRNIERIHIVVVQNRVFDADDRQDVIIRDIFVVNCPKAGI